MRKTGENCEDGSSPGSRHGMKSGGTARRLAQYERARARKRREEQRAKPFTPYQAPARVEVKPYTPAQQLEHRLARAALREARAFVPPAGPARTPPTKRRKRSIVRGLLRAMRRAQLTIKNLSARGDGFGVAAMQEVYAALHRQFTAEVSR